MSADLPPQLQNQLQQLQRLQQQTQSVMLQRQQMELSVRELDRTLQALEGADADTPVFRSVGSILVKAKDPGAVRAELAEQKETSEVRLRTVKRQEEQLREKLTSLQKEVEAALQGLGGPRGPMA